MNQPSPAHQAEPAPPDHSRRWNYAGAIGAGIAALLVVALGVAVPLQVIPPKKEEAVAMVAPPVPPPRRPPEYGLASWYGDHEAGLPTASGATFKPEALTAAHRWLPLGTKVKVTRLGTKTQHSIVVTINDRGPYVGGRLIDVSPAAARQLAMVDKGVARVRVDVLEVPRHPAPDLAAKRGKKKSPAEEVASQPPPEAPPAETKPAPAEAATAPQARPAAAPAKPDSNTHFP